MPGRSTCRSIQIPAPGSWSGAWLFQHDGYVFGSGYFAPDARVQQMVEGALLLYGERGEEAFGMITPQTPPSTVAFHPFVLNATTAEAMAGGAYPQLLGTIPDVLLNGADRPYGEIQDDLNRDGATWASYMFTNPHTRTEQLMRTWLYLHDGLIFASGYYLPDSRARSLTDEIVSIYDRDREGAPGEGARPGRGPATNLHLRGQPRHPDHPGRQRRRPGL